jgi:antitoxin component YwqK of YwqJK toxin-antitoxin module
MKPLLTLILSLSFTLTAFGQQGQYPDSGFTNKAEAKNLMVNGKKEGKWIEYVGGIFDTIIDSNAYFYQLTIYSAAVPRGMQRLYRKTGELFSETPYKNGKINGTYKRYFEWGGLIEKCTFIDDKKVGIDIWYNESDKGSKLWREIPYIDGKINGVIKEYSFGDGKLEGETPYTNGKRNGIEKRYYSYDKHLMRETTFIDDTVIGVIKEYYDDGKLKDETPCTNGKRNGVEKEYYESGKIHVMTTYENGKSLSQIMYDESGNEIKQ